MTIAKFDNEDFRNKAPDLLADLAKHSVNIIKQHADIEDDLAENIGMLIAMKIGESWGGLNIYMPKAQTLFFCEREKQIYNDFTGNNHAYLARKYKLSLQCIYQIVKRVQQDEINKRQYQMFCE